MGVIRKDGLHWNVYWYGHLSACRAHGAIESYLHEQSGSNATVFIHDSDGFIGSGDFDRAIEETHVHTVDGTTPLTATLCCQRLPPEQRDRILLTPLDDDTFQHGLRQVLSQYPQPAWGDRKPVAFWRGVGSGYETPSLRKRVVDTLMDHSNSDVRFARWGGCEASGFPPHYFADRCPIETHMQYKYVLIVDGNCIASSHQWVFGSGSVPIMVTHPENDYWFRKFLKPMVHYVPIQYDLSDLREKIDWLVANDQEAQTIATNAREFADTVFTPEFQRNYITTELTRLLNCTSSAMTHPSSEPSPVECAEPLQRPEHKET